MKTRNICKSLSLLLCLALLMCCTGCAEESGERVFFAMDTYMTVTVRGDNAQSATDAVCELVTQLDTRLSRTAEGSDIFKINNSGTEGCTVSAETAELISLCIEYHELTYGAFNAAIGPVMDAWGFASGGDNGFRVPSDGELDVLLDISDPKAIHVSGSTVYLEKQGMVLDLGGVGKGYAADKAAEKLRSLGIRNAIISLGGNVWALGKNAEGKPWRVAVQNPDGTSNHIGILSLTDTSAVTTGGYRRYFEEDGITYHHVIDPATGYPADSGIVSATIICPDSAKADILSTSVFILGTDKALELYNALGGFEMLLLTSDGYALATPGAAEVFSIADGCGYALKIIQ